MTERPITLHPHELQAALAGKLRHVRRPVVCKPSLYGDGKVHPAVSHFEWCNGTQYWRFCASDEIKDRYITTFPLDTIKCPLGQPGDVIWGRERWMPDPPMDGTWDFYGFTDGLIYNFKALPEKYKTPRHCIFEAGWSGTQLKWMPASRMPRWASRWARHVAAVRVERIRDMTNRDAIACGYKDITEFVCRWLEDCASKGLPSGYNPWVWVADLDSKGEQQ